MKNIIHNLLPKQKQRKQGLTVSINLYDYAAELYDELERIGIINRMKSIAHLGVISVPKRLRKTRYDYIMLQMYFHQVVKRKLQSYLKYTYNNLAKSTEFHGIATPKSFDQKPSIGDMLQLLCIAYSIGHFHNTFTASRAAVLLAKDYDYFAQKLISSSSDPRFKPAAEKIIIESMLQHYGFRTRFQDFVDNHWTALWFGLYELQKEKMKGSRKDQEFYNYYYTRRSPIYPIKKEKPSCLTLKEPSLLELPSKPALFDIVSPDDYTPDMIGDQKNAHQILNLKESKTREKALRKLIEKDISEKERKNRQKIEKWEKEVKKIKAINDHSLEQYKIDQESDIAYVYILLYVADTKGENFKGVYTGTETITIDLRKSLPSVLLRPCAQHGWTVKRMGNDSDLSEGVVCVLRLTVDLVSEMMGEGLLVKPENFFPPIEYDNGYKILLGRETPAPFGSPAAKNPRDLPSLFPFGSLQHFVIK